MIGAGGIISNSPNIRQALICIVVMIGAGGIISNSPNIRQALICIVDGLNPQGITEIWRDNHFISPHLGKLGYNRNLAR